jgi:hypothetical protein
MMKQNKTKRSTNNLTTESTFFYCINAQIYLYRKYLYANMKTARNMELWFGT